MSPKYYETIFVSTNTFEKIIEYSDETFYDPQSKINFSSNTFQGLGDTNKEHIQNGHFIASPKFMTNVFNITEEEVLALDGTLVELDLTSYGYPFKKELIFNMFPSGFRFPSSAYPSSIPTIGTLHLSDDDYKIIKDSINYDILKDPYLIYEDYYYISDVEESSTLIFELLATENAPGNLIFKGVYYFNLKSYNNFIDSVRVYSYFISIVLILLIFIGLIFKGSLFSKVSLKYNYTFTQIFLAGIFKGILQILLMIPISYLLYNLIKGVMQKSFYFVYENISLSILVIFILSLSYLILKQIGSYLKLRFIANKRLF